MLRLIVQTCLVLFLTSCNFGPNPCETGYSWDQFDYEVNVTQETPTYGIQVDDSGHDIDLVLVDEIYEEVVACLEKNFPGGEIPMDVRKQSYCYQEEWAMPPAGTVTLKIPGQYVMSCPGDRQQQLLLDVAEPELCANKGLIETSDCKCRWRAGIQDSCTAVTTPSLYMLKDPLVKIMTGCWYIWRIPDLSECASPSVERR